MTDELRERFLATFLEEWPERDVPEDELRTSLELTVTADAVTAKLLGHEVTYAGIEPGEDLTDVVDDLAAHLADNAEGDRLERTGEDG